MVTPQALPNAMRVSAANRRGGDLCRKRVGLGLSLMMVGAGFILAPTLAQSQARGANPPLPAARPSGPAPVIIPPVSAEPVSARLIIRLEQVERQAAEMTGRIEILEAELSKQRESQAQLMRELEAERANKLTVTETEPARGAPSPTISTEAQGPVSEAPAAPTLEGPNPQMPPPPAETVAAALPSAETLFHDAQLALQRGDYLAAETNLNNLVTHYPTAPEGIEGRWLLGEARFVQSAWGPAAEAYLGYLDAAPQGRRASESLVRLAGAFGQMGNSKMRCQALAEYRRRTPSPDATLKARADAEAARSPCPTT